MTTPTAFKVLTAQQWADFERERVFRGAPVDIADGFIHFSFAEQVPATVAKYFSGRDDLLLVEVDPARLGEALKHEPSRGGALFPHLYGSLPLSAVIKVDVYRHDYP